MDILELVHENHEVTMRPFTCGLDPGRCSKAFARRSDLVRHERIHRNERPFQCAQCGKSFIQRSALTVHIRVHTGERPHLCTVEGCHKAFADSSSLARHRRVHTGKRPYQCSVDGCCKTFCRKTTLTKHIKRNHGPSALAFSVDYMAETTETCFGLGNSTDEDEKPTLMSSSWYGPAQPPESQNTTPSPDSRPRDFEQTKTFHLSRQPAYLSETPSPFFDRAVEQNPFSVPFSSRQPPPPQTHAGERLGTCTHNIHHSSRLSSPHAFPEPFVANLTHHSEHTSPSNQHHLELHPEHALGDHLQSFFSFPQVRHLVAETDQLDSENELYSSNQRRMSSFSEGSLQLEHHSHHHNVYLDSNSIRRETGEMIQELPGVPISTWPYKHLPVTEVDGMMNMTSSLIPISASNRILCNNNDNDDQCLSSLESDPSTENNLYQLDSIYQDHSHHHSLSESYRSILGSNHCLYGINHSPIIAFNSIYNHHNTTNE